MIEDADIIKAVKESGGLRDCARKLGIHPSSLSKYEATQVVNMYAN